MLPGNHKRSKTFIFRVSRPAIRCLEHSATGDFLELADEDWGSTIASDVLPAVGLCRAFIPAMRAKTWGRIVLFTSEDGAQP